MKRGSRPCLAGMLPLLGLLLLAFASPATAAPRRAAAAAETRAATPTAELALIAIDQPAAGTAARLLDAGVMVVRDLQRYLLVAATAEDRALLDRLGLRWSLLDASITGKTYYTAGVLPGARLAALESAARVLRYDGREAVIEAPPERVEVATRGLEIARVFMRPIRLAPPVKPFPRGAFLEHDPVIQEMVDAVSGPQIDATVQRLQDFVTRYATHDSCLAASHWIRDQFVSFGIDSVYFQDFGGGYNDNVVAVIPGTRNPEKIVVIGGHYDSITSNHNIAPGADDDASGTACVVEAARVLSQYPHDYTITFVAFCAEEEGLIGSDAYASTAAQNGDQIIGAVCVDMIGYLAPGDVIDLDIIDNASSAWMRDLVLEVGANYVPGFPVVDGSLPGGASSDHASFWSSGYDALLFFEDTGDYSPYIHTASDVVGTSYNNPELAVNSVRVAVGLLATMAGSPPLVITHTPLGHTTNTQDPYRVVAEIVATGTLAPDSLLVRYATPAGTFDLTMTPTGNPDQYETFIPAQPGGTFVDYYLIAQDIAGHRATDPADAPASVYTFFVGTITTVVADDFETDSGWTVGDAGDDATTGIWVRADPNGTWSGSTPVQPEDDHTPAPGVQCFVTGNAPPGSSQGQNDVDGGKTTVLSPIYDLGALPNAWVRYHRWFVNDTGSSPGQDPWAVDVSSDGGATWHRIEETYAAHHGWLLVERDLAAAIDLTSNVKLRFIARDDPPGSIVEAAIDDFALLTFEEPSTAVTEQPAAGLSGRLALAQNAPNPFNPRTTIRFEVPAAGRVVTLRVYDTSGRLVRTLLERAPRSGPQAIEWDGRSARGATVGSGVYFVRLEAQGGPALTRKLVLAR